MKLHRTTSEAVIQSLDDIFNGRRYADKVIEKVLKSNPRWGSRDRRFIAETTYDIVRWYRLLDHVSGSNQNFWDLLGAWCILHDIMLPAWPELNGLSPGAIRARLQAAQPDRKLRESIPDWLDDQGSRELGDRWEKEIAALNQEAQVVLRANTIKISCRDLERTLQEETIRTFPLIGFPDALVLEERQNVFGSPAFKNGLFEVMDAASQLIAPFMRVEPGMRVIDACAGAGGKTLHIAALMQNKGRIVSMDVESHKLEELQKRARRAGVSNVEIRHIENSKAIKRLEETADRLLLDVPCSGLGVLRRNPDAKWKLSPDFIEKVQVLQNEILTGYSTMVKKGGMMIYSTCSIMPSENEEQVKSFLQHAGDKFQLVEEKHAWPSEGFDGFYMALLRRIG